MNRRKIILGLFVATLGASFMHQASAWGTGGATTIPRKSHLSGYNLFCDMSRVSFGGYTIPAVDRVKVVTSPSATNLTDPPSLTFSGEMFCAEVLPTNPSPSLESAVVVSGVPFVGRFKLTQQSPAQRLTSTLTHTETGLVFSGPDGNGVRTWTFVVPASTQFPFPELLYDLAPADAATTTRFCEPSVTGCKLLIGLHLPAQQSDYPARDIDGLPPSPDLSLGQVFKFTTKTTGGVEAAGQFFWGPCRSDAFGKPTTVVVDASANNSKTDAGLPSSTGKDTLVDIVLGNRLAVTVNQNDLWNSGPLPRWSNADGQVRNMLATGPVVHDDSQTNTAANGGPPAPGQQLGQNTGFANLGGAVFKFQGGSWVPAPEGAPIGALVGSIAPALDGGSTFYIFGTAFDGPAPATGRLKLYYWDNNCCVDNTESVQVTVATESIQCTDNQGSTVVQGNARGEFPVEVATLQQTLNVENESSAAAFPLAILGCNIGEPAITFGPNGSPIVLGTKVLVNGKSVNIKNSNVANVVSRPSCDSGQALADLKLGLNQLQFIRAVVGPSGKCRNGPIGYSITLGNATDGFYGGQSTVRLNKCKDD